MGKKNKQSKRKIVSKVRVLKKVRKNKVKVKKKGGRSASGKGKDSKVKKLLKFLKGRKKK